jgi:hypothetical protein
MTDLQTKTQNALDEGRTLILGAQILLGCLYRSAFEPVYAHFSSAAKYLVACALGLIIVSIVVLMAPAPYHRIVEQGRDSKEFNAFVLSIMKVGLIPFALSIGLSLYVFVHHVLGRDWGIFLGSMATGSAIFFWYGLRLLHRERRGH